jgi:hypothetical protein
MNILEDPLGRTITLPDASAVEQRALRAAQQDLRDAVASSRRLQVVRSTAGVAPRARQGACQHHAPVRLLVLGAG